MRRGGNAFPPSRSVMSPFYLSCPHDPGAAGRDMVCEGRDQGTIVFPDAACKFFLEAEPAERARRRHREMAARGEVASPEDVLRAQEFRDLRDAARDLAPMVPAPDAIRLD